MSETLSDTESKKFSLGNYKELGIYIKCLLKSYSPLFMK